MAEQRKNWKENIGKAAKRKADKRTALLVQKDLVSRQIHALTMDEIRSDLYVGLKKQEREIVAELATL